ncbi:MAG: helix-turn-helix transcriptional regulator [Maritimibacter sp.]
MSRADRLFRMLDALRRLPAPVTAARLAQDLEVSLRTVYRDIEGLRAAGALIDGAAGYGYSLTEDPAVPPQMFERIELEALVLGLGMLRWQGDPEMAAAAEAALGKLTASLPERKAEEARHVVALSYRFDPAPEVPAFLALVRQASWDERAVTIAYRDRNGVASQRKVWPLAIYYMDNGPWLMAWCCLRNGFRRFQFFRIGEARLESESFRPRRVQLLREMHAAYQMR